jgi:RecA/RadA recombinase
VEKITLSEKEKKIMGLMKSLGVSTESWKSGDKIHNPAFTSSGIVEIDSVLGENSGFADGSLVVLVGDSGSGKTYSALKAIKAQQEAGRAAAFFNIENTFYPPRAEQIGVDIYNKELFDLFDSVGSAEKNGEMVKALVESAMYGIIVLDSVTALIPSADYDRPLDETPMVGAHARFISRFTQSLLPLCEKTGTIVILINQFRYGTGARPNTFVKKMGGGESLRYYAHTILTYTKINGADGQIIDSEKNIIGGKSRVYVMKNRYGMPDLETIIPIHFTKAESDYVGEFLYRITKSRDLEKCVTFSRKIYRYIDDETGEVLVQTKNEIEFIEGLMEQQPPKNRPAKDTSSNAFEYACSRLKIKGKELDSLIEAIEQKKIANLETQDDAEQSFVDLDDN